MAEKETIAKEAGHYNWAKDGSPAYEMPNKSRGGMRPTTMRDFRKLVNTDDRIVPSVTTILRILDKPGLEAWKIRQVLESAYTCPFSRNIGADEWIERVKADAEEQAKLAAKKGKELHAVIEKGFQGQPVPPQYRIRFNKVCAQLKEHGVVPQGIQAEKSFANERYGGKVDIFAPASEYVIIPVVADLKTTEFTLIDGKPFKNGKPAKLAWDEHLYQLCGYGDALAPSAILLNTFVSTIDHSVYTHKWSEEDIDRGTRVFRTLTDLWWIING